MALTTTAATTTTTATTIATAMIQERKHVTDVSCQGVTRKNSSLSYSFFLSLRIYLLICLSLGLYVAVFTFSNHLSLILQLIFPLLPSFLNHFRPLSFIHFYYSMLFSYKFLCLSLSFLIVQEIIQQNLSGLLTARNGGGVIYVTTQNQQSTIERKFFYTKIFIFR